MKLDIQKFANGIIDGDWTPRTGGSGSCDSRMVWTSTPGTSEQNYSSVYVEFQIYKSGSSSTTGTFSGTITINDTNYSISKKFSPYRWGNWETVGSATGIVPHNSDGTKTCYIAGWVYNTGTSMAGDYGGNSNVQLDTIPRASQPTLNVSSATLGSTSITITTNRQSTNFTHTIETKINNSVIETFTGITTSKTFTPSISNYAPYITGSATAQLSIATTTYSGTTKIGDTYTNTLTLSVPDNSTTKPLVAIGTLSEGATGVIPSGWNVFVQGKSKLAYTLTGTPKYSASISNYTSYISGEVVYSGASITSNVLKNAGSNTLTAQSQDSRGFWSEADTETFNVVAYSNPLISEVKAERCNSDGTLADDGIYLKYTFKGSVSPVNNGTSDLNAKSYKIQWKESEDTTWNDISITNDAYTINKEDIVLSGTTFSYSTTFNIRFAITDSFTTTYSSIITLGTGKDLLNFNASGKSMAIGKVSEAGSNEELLEIALDTEISGDVDIVSSTTPLLKMNGVGTLKRGSTGATILSSNVYPIYFRPNGDSDQTSQVAISTSGAITTSGAFTTTGNDTGFTCDNTTASRKGKFTSSGGGRLGIYDNTNSSWVIVSETNQNVSIPHPLSVAGSITSNGKSVPVMKELYSNTTGSQSVNIGESTSNYSLYILTWGIAIDEKRSDVFIPNFQRYNFTQIATKDYWSVYEFNNSGNNITMTYRIGQGWSQTAKIYKIIGVKF